MVSSPSNALEQPQALYRRGLNKRTSNVPQSFVVPFLLGGRRSLTVANYLVNRITKILMPDLDHLRIWRESWRHRSLVLADPNAKWPREVHPAFVAGPEGFEPYRSDLI